MRSISNGILVIEYNQSNLSSQLEKISTGSLIFLWRRGEKKGLLIFIYFTNITWSFRSNWKSYLFTFVSGSLPEYFRILNATYFLFTSHLTMEKVLKTNDTLNFYVFFIYPLLPCSIRLRLLTPAQRDAIDILKAAQLSPKALLRSRTLLKTNRIQ